MVAKENQGEKHLFRGGGGPCKNLFPKGQKALKNPLTRSSTVGLSSLVRSAGHEGMTINQSLVVSFEGVPRFIPNTGGAFLSEHQQDKFAGKSLSVATVERRPARTQRHDVATEGKYIHA